LLDVKYLKKTNDTVKWFLKKDLDSWYKDENIEIINKYKKNKNKLYKKTYNNYKNNNYIPFEDRKNIKLKKKKLKKISDTVLIFTNNNLPYNENFSKFKNLYSNNNFRFKNYLIKNNIKISKLLINHEFNKKNIINNTYFNINLFYTYIKSKNNFITELDYPKDNYNYINLFNDLNINNNYNNLKIMFNNDKDDNLELNNYEYDSNTIFNYNKYIEDFIDNKFIKFKNDKYGSKNLIKTLFDLLIPKLNNSNYLNNYHRNHNIFTNENNKEIYLDTISNINGWLLNESENSINEWSFYDNDKLVKDFNYFYDNEKEGLFFDNDYNDKFIYNDYYMLNVVDNEDDYNSKNKLSIDINKESFNYLINYNNNKSKFLNNIDIIKKKINNDYNFSKFSDRLRKSRLKKLNQKFNKRKFMFQSDFRKKSSQKIKLKEKKKINESKVNRIVNNSEPWSINNSGLIPDFAILNHNEKNKNNIINNNNTLNALNFSIGNNMSIFDVLTNLNSTDIDKKNNAAKILTVLNVEATELKNPWLSSELQLSKKANFINSTISNNIDSLLLDSVIEAKLNLNWKKNKIYDESFSRNIIKKKMFKTFDSNSRVRSNKNNIKRKNNSLKDFFDIDFLLSNIEFSNNNLDTFPLFIIKENKSEIKKLSNENLIMILRNFLINNYSIKNLNLENFNKIINENSNIIYFIIENNEFIKLYRNNKDIIESFNLNKKIHYISLFSGYIGELKINEKKNNIYYHFSNDTGDLISSKSPYFYKQNNNIIQSIDNVFYMKENKLVLFTKSYKNNIKNEIPSLNNSIKIKINNEISNLSKYINNSSITFNLAFFSLISDNRSLSYDIDSFITFKSKVFESKVLNSDLNYYNKLIDNLNYNNNLIVKNDNIKINSNWFPYLHITKDGYEIPSYISSGYFIGNTLITNNTRKVLIFNLNGNLIDIIKIDIKFKNEKEKFDLPKIFDGSTFEDSIGKVDENFYEYFKKVAKYYKLKDKLKNNLINNKFKEKKGFSTKNLNNNTEFKNKLPLLFQNEKFLKKLLISNSKNSNLSYFDNVLGLWPSFNSRPLVLPDINENYSFNRLIRSRKNLKSNRIYEKNRFLFGNRSNLNNLFEKTIKPGIFINKSISNLINNDISTRFLPQVEFKKGFEIFPNLEEYNITPGNLTEQFWNEENIAKKFQIIPSFSYIAKNGFKFLDRSGIDAILQPIMSGDDNFDSNYNNSKTFWWDSENSYFDNYEEIQKRPIPEMFWTNQTLPEYWNLMIKRESRSIISKIINSSDSLFKYDWLRGSLYSNLLGSLNEDTVSNNLININKLLPKNMDNLEITGRYTPKIINSQDAHIEERAYRDWRYNGIEYDYDKEDEEYIGMSNRPNHNVLHTNYDDLLFEEFKWLNTDVETTDWIRQRPIDLSSSFDFGDELPEIQLKFRESIDDGHNLERISKYILNLDDFLFKEKYINNTFELNFSTEKFRKYKETFKFEIEDDFLKFSDKKFNQNSLSDIYKNNDKDTYFQESLFSVASKNNNFDYDYKIVNKDINNDINKIPYKMYERLNNEKK